MWQVTEGPGILLTSDDDNKESPFIGLLNVCHVSGIGFRALCAFDLLILTLTTREK